ncbi:MAG TPA: MerR family transcriptional regulator [Thermoanaerobaculia bacterium]|nr:MerR family transcriptional regulator [Thermoanaerobaculia bacterium]
MTRESDALGVPDGGDAAPAPALERRMYTLSELAQITGIAYGTITAYLRAHPGRVPFKRVARARRFPVEAVSILLEIRKERHERIGQHWRKRSRPMARWEEQRQLAHRIEKKAAELNGLIRELQATVERSRPEGGEA